MKIEAYFDSIKRAREAVEKLREEGFKGAFVDINEHNNDVYSQSGMVGTDKISTLSAAVLGEDNSNSPIAAASPMASGMGGFQEIASINCKVVVEADGNNEENVINLIKDMGGTTKDLNTGRIPKGLDNINEDVLVMKNLEE
ncbi:hypothetical protein CSC2_50790 [Clostridium zeae]|uniref:General stress protein 17M-like domain-containing protein n=1 Tax=Clostridium zeae TaxID=2759022 RepID=A0ABQ1EI93_9CLOT|nr:hypothetical protein [Clostridium zeae]GFZ34553.1 hypothetical protein CSC2_50790 [Clostridium zeae]